MIAPPDNPQDDVVFPTPQEEIQARNVEIKGLNAEIKRLKAEIKDLRERLAIPGLHA